MPFDTSFDRLLGSEGGYTAGRGDPGGETHWGISKRSYPKLNIKALTREQAKAIYRKDFWNYIEADKLPFSITYQLFDFAVNSGIKVAITHFQHALKVDADGIWGPLSAAAAAKMSETDMLMLLLAERLEFMADLGNWRLAGRGWVRRIAANLRYGSIDT
jgi:lysozyme family protein